MQNKMFPTERSRASRQAPQANYDQITFSLQNSINQQPRKTKLNCQLQIENKNNWKHTLNFRQIHQYSSQIDTQSPDQYIYVIDLVLLKDDEANFDQLQNQEDKEITEQIQQDVKQVKNVKEINLLKFRTKQLIDQIKLRNEQIKYKISKKIIEPQQQQLLMASKNVISNKQQINMFNKQQTSYLQQVYEQLYFQRSKYLFVIKKEFYYNDKAQNEQYFQEQLNKSFNYLIIKENDFLTYMSQKMIITQLSVLMQQRTESDDVSFQNVIIININNNLQQLVDIIQTIDSLSQYNQYQNIDMVRQLQNNFKQSQTFLTSNLTQRQKQIKYYLQQPIQYMQKQNYPRDEKNELMYKSVINMHSCESYQNVLIKTFQIKQHDVYTHTNVKNHLLSNDVYKQYIAKNNKKIFNNVEKQFIKDIQQISLQLKQADEASLLSDEAIKQLSKQNNNQDKNKKIRRNQTLQQNQQAQLNQVFQTEISNCSNDYDQQTNFGNSSIIQSNNNIVRSSSIIIPRSDFNQKDFNNVMSVDLQQNNDSLLAAKDKITQVKNTLFDFVVRTSVYLLNNDSLECQLMLQNSRNQQIFDKSLTQKNTSFKMINQKGSKSKFDVQLNKFGTIDDITQNNCPSSNCVEQVKQQSLSHFNIVQLAESFDLTTDVNQQTSNKEQLKEIYCNFMGSQCISDVFIRNFFKQQSNLVYQFDSFVNQIAYFVNKIRFPVRIEDGGQIDYVFVLEDTTRNKLIGYFQFNQQIFTNFQENEGNFNSDVVTFDQSDINFVDSYYKQYQFQLIMSQVAIST